jgi:enoyl-CoA hydratase
MNYQTIILEKKKSYAIVKLNRPNEMNAIDKNMRRELFDVFSELEEDQDVNAIIMTGGGYVFSTGMDLKEITALPDTEIDDCFDSMRRHLTKIYTCTKPVIAAVGGIALGGGFNLVTVCDLVVASEGAIFCHPELKFGINPIYYPLSQIVGAIKAKEIIMLGEPIGAIESLRIGLVNKVVPPDKFMQEAENMAEILSMRSAKAMEELKKICEIVPRMDKKSALDLEFSVGARLFARDERKVHMNEVLFLEKLRKKKQK